MGAVSGSSQRVALLCITWNSAGCIASFLGSLDEGLRGVEDWTLLVVDNASSDDTVDIVRDLLPRATVLQTGRNAGYAAAVNVGLAAAAGADVVLVLNPDVSLAPGCVAELVHGLDRPGVGIVTPRQRDAHGALLPTLRREPTVRRALGEALVGGLRAGRRPAWGELVVDDTAYDRATVADWATGSALAIARDCLDDVGPWDERFFLYSEETDFALRARDLGHRLLLVPSAECRHDLGASHSSPQLWALLCVNRIRLFEQRHSATHTLAFRAAVVTGEALRCGASWLRGDRSRARVHRAALGQLLSGDGSVDDLISRLQAASPGG